MAMVVIDHRVQPIQHVSQERLRDRRIVDVDDDLAHARSQPGRQRRHILAGWPLGDVEPRIVDLDRDLRLRSMNHRASPSRSR
jgi:hypothetical protein